MVTKVSAYEYVCAFALSFPIFFTFLSIFLSYGESGEHVIIPDIQICSRGLDENKVWGVSCKYNIFRLR